MASTAAVVVLSLLLADGPFDLKTPEPPPAPRIPRLLPAVIAIIGGAMFIAGTAFSFVGDQQNKNPAAPGVEAGRPMVMGGIVTSFLGMGIALSSLLWFAALRAEPVEDDDEPSQ